MLHTVRDYFTIRGGREGGKNKCHARGYELPLTQFFSPRNPLVLKVFKTFTKQLLSQTLYLGIYQSASCKRFNFFYYVTLCLFATILFLFFFFFKLASRKGCIIILLFFLNTCLYITFCLLFALYDH